MIPIHGDAPHLPALLSSLNRQEFVEENEIIFSLDAVSSKVLSLIMSSQLNNVRLIEVSKSGIANAHNAGLFAARYDLTAVVHSDDVVLSGRFRVQSQYLRNNPEVVCVGGQTMLIDEAGDLIGKSFFPLTDSLIRLRMRSETPVAHPTVMYRTELARDLGGYKEALVPAEDYALWVQMSKYGKIRNLPSPLIQYRIHSKQTSQTKRLEQIDQKVRLMIQFRHRNRSKSRSNVVSDSRLYKNLYDCEIRLGKIAQLKVERKMTAKLIPLFSILIFHPLETTLRLFFYCYGFLKIRNYPYEIVPKC
jgi:glycosyltransferase involved in cell wall biosynthesis